MTFLKKKTLQGVKEDRAQTSELNPFAFRPSHCMTLSLHALIHSSFHMRIETYLPRNLILIIENGLLGLNIRNAI